MLARTPDCEKENFMSFSVQAVSFPPFTVISAEKSDFSGCGQTMWARKVYVMSGEKVDERDSGSEIVRAR